MGCHTWFYKKADYDYEVARTALMKHYTKYIKFFKKLMYNRKEMKWYLKSHKVSIEMAKKTVDLLKRKRRILSKGLCKEATIIHWCKLEGHLTVHIKGKGIFTSEDDLPHDLFRIHNYPEDKLFSLEETLKFIEDHKSEITHYHSNKYKTFDELIREFWSNHPDGLIDFG